MPKQQSLKEPVIRQAIIDLVLPSMAEMEHKEPRFETKSACRNLRRICPGVNSSETLGAVKVDMGKVEMTRLIETHPTREVEREEIQETTSGVWRESALSET